MSLGIRFDLSQLEEKLGRRIRRLEKADRRALAEDLGATMESQTRRRITDTKRGPDGDPWARWSAMHAATRHGGHSLLMGGGDLLDSITYQASSDSVEVGSNVVYAAVHQFGAEQGEFGRTGRGAPIPFGDIPARPYVGIGSDDEAELQDVVDDWVDGELRL